MSRRRFGEHHRQVPVNTASVTGEAHASSHARRPRTGRVYLDAVGPDGVIAMAHRGGALHPEIPGVENTLHAFEHAVALGYEYLETDVHVTRDGVLLAFHDDVLDRVTDATGRLADLSAEQISAARIREQYPVPTMAELLEAFPGCRFNIDLKSRGAVDALADLIDRTGSHDRICVGSFSQTRLDAFRAASHGRVATSPPPRGGAVHGLPQRSAGPPADPRPGQCPAGAAPPWSPAPSSPVRWYVARTGWGPGARVDRRRARRDGAAARPRRRRPDHRPDRRTQGRPHQARTVEEHTIVSTAAIGRADLSAAERLQQQKAWNWYDWANSAYYTTVLSVLFAPYMSTVAGTGRRLRRRRRLLQQDGEPARPAPRRRVAAVLPDQLRHHRQRVRAAGRRRLRRPLEPQEVEHGRLRLRRLRSSACCCSSCRATSGSWPRSRW